MKARKLKSTLTTALMTLAIASCNSETKPAALTQADPTVPVETPPAAPNPTQPSVPTTPPAADLYTGPADIEKYVLKFIDDAKIQGIDVVPDMADPKLEIRIASLDSYGSSTIGLCETSGSRRRVTFDPDLWDSVSETQRELLALHELGHCVLYRAHRSTKLSSGAYASIMYPIIMSSSTYTSNYDYYQEELFTYGAMEPAAADGIETTHICDLSELQ
jgi:hypothetical protein